MRYDPELVLMQSGLDAGTAAAFLLENAPHFIEDSAIGDLADATGYLSDAGALADP